MNHNVNALNNINYNMNENYQYSDGINSNNKLRSLLNMNNRLNDRTNKNLNVEYFKNFYQQNNNESENKKSNFNAIKNDIYGYSHFLNEQNNDNNKIIYSSKRKRKNFFNNYFNEEIQYMNMKIDLKVIEHKLNCLLSIYSPDEIYTPKVDKDNYEENNSPNIINNENNDNDYQNKYTPINDDKSNSDNNEENINLNNNQELENEYDNNSVNDQKMEMAIENVVSFNNIKESEEKNNKDTNKVLKIKKNNIIYLLNNENEKSNFEKENNEPINENNINKINNINNTNNINSDEKLHNNNNIANLISKSNENNDNDINIDNNIVSNINSNINNNIDNDIDNNIDNDINDNDKKEEEEENLQMIPEKDYSVGKDIKIDNQSKKEKKITFDENVVYINYDQDNYVTELELTDQNGKILPYKEKDITKYLRLLTSLSVNNKLKSNIAQSRKKRKKKKKTKIMERNMEYIKQIEKTGNIYGNMKDHEKKPPNSESKNCRKFMENPQHFFTEDLCDVMLLQYDINPKDHLNPSMSFNKKYKEKK